MTNWTEEQYAQDAARRRIVNGEVVIVDNARGGCTVDCGQDSDGSPLERRFAAMWQQLDGPPLEREYRFAAPRRWRADFANVAARVLVELEGGTYSNGRHTRHAGYKADAEKYNAAQMLGWQVYRYTGDMITADALTDLAAHMRQREAQQCSGSLASAADRQ